MFDIDQLIANQHKHIESMGIDPDLSIPKTFFDNFIVEAFSNFPLEDTLNVRLHSIDRPLALLGGAPCISRASFLRLSAFGGPEAKSYVSCLSNVIVEDLKRLEPGIIYYFGMWVPVYSTPTVITSTIANTRIMTHYARRLVKDELFPLKELISSAQAVYLNV